MTRFGLVSISVIAMIAVAVIAAAQTARPQFEVASIKPSTDGSGPAGIKRTPGQFITSSLSVPFLIRWAYDLDEDRLVGTPKGSDSIKFDIVAKIPADVELIPGQTLRMMMQSLLSERFHLRVHNETRELSSYTLVTDKDGPKVRFVDAAQPIGQNPFNMTDGGRLAGTRVTAEMLAKVVADLIKRPVEDSTGIKEPFDFVLEWAPDSVLDQEEAPGAAVPARASIFTAIREQLGFRLNARKSAIEVVVIDHVDKTPTDN